MMILAFVKAYTDEEVVADYLYGGALGSSCQEAYVHIIGIIRPADFNCAIGYS
jgi:hypothetical protein